MAAKKKITDKVKEAVEKVRDETAHLYPSEIREQIARPLKEDKKMRFRFTDPKKVSLRKRQGWIIATKKHWTPANDKVTWRDGAWLNESNFVLMCLPKEVDNKKMKDRVGRYLDKVGLPKNFNPSKSIEAQIRKSRATEAAENYYKAHGGQETDINEAENGFKEEFIEASKEAGLSPAEAAKVLGANK